MLTNFHFIAVLKFKSPEQGGRNTPAYTGYRPQIKFNFSEMQTSGSQNFIGKEKVNPGEEVLAEITVASPQILKKQLEVGMPFEFREGKIIIGTGQIKLINDKTREIEAGT